jgi:hypothetical protein
VSAASQRARRYQYFVTSCSRAVPMNEFGAINPLFAQVD